MKENFSSGHETKLKRYWGKRLGTPFSAYYGVTPQGNFEEGKSVLHVDVPLEKVSQLYGVPIPGLEALLGEGRKRLFHVREKRVKPGRDEKILTSWNGLMISGFVDGYQVTGDEKYLHGAEEAARFILREMRKDGHLMRVFNRGRCHVKGYSEDYAFFTQALIDLYEATFEIDWLKEANDLNESMIEQFWDGKNGGVFFSGKKNESLIAQSKSPYDNAVPSSNSVVLFNFVRLGHLTGEDSLKRKAEKILHLFYNYLSEHPSGFSHMLSGFSFFMSPEEIGIVGPMNDPRTQAMLREVYLAFLPNKILSFKDPKEQSEGNWMPFLKDKEVKEGSATFVCKGFTCLPPAQDEKELKKILG